MKMNIKGLVFVGFAAAVFAGAANAATDPSNSSKTVTSLKYTDATYEKLANKVDTLNPNLSDDVKKTNYPSQKAIEGYMTSNQADWDEDETSEPSYIVNKPTIAHAAADITGATDQDNKELTTTYAVQQYVSGELTDNQADWNQIDNTKPDYIENKPTIAHAAADITGATDQDNKELPTTYAVQQYVSGELTDNQADWNQIDNTKPDYIENKPTIAHAAADITGATDQDNKELPTTYAVQQYVSGELTDNQADWNQIDNTKPDYIENKPTIAHAAADITGATDQDNKELTTTYAVQQYVQTLVPGTLPDTCTADAPCALVLAGTTPTWEPIQQ